MKSQMELYNISAPTNEVSRSAYANLIKASGILVDIIASHPQCLSVTAGTLLEAQSLSTEIKKELARVAALGLKTPGFGEIEKEDLQIWETSMTPSPLRPHKHPYNSDEWTVEGGEQVLFQRFAIYESYLTGEPLPCITFLLVKFTGARLIAQHQNGSIIMTVACQSPSKKFNANAHNA